MAPPAYKDVQKSAKDLLKDDYVFDKKFKLSTKTGNGIALTTEGTMSAKGTEGKLTAKFKVEQISIDKLSTSTNGRLTCEASAANVVDGLKLGVKFEDGVPGSGNSAGSLNATYSQANFTLYSELDIINGPILSGSATVHKNQFLAGAEFKYNTQYDDKEASAALEDAGAVVAYNAGDFSCSVQALEKAKKFSLACHQVVDKDTKIAAVFEVEPKANGSRVMTVGGTRVLDAETAFAAKVDSKGIVQANWIQKLSPQVKVIASASVDAKNFAGDQHRLGLQLILGA